MAYSAVGSITGATASGALASFSLTTSGVGNFVLIIVGDYTGTRTATALSSTNCTWSTIGNPAATSAGPGHLQAFVGQVTSAATATVTITWGAGTTGSFEAAVKQEFSTTTGMPVIDKQGNVDNGSGTASFPSLSPVASGELYFAYAFNTGTSGGGATSGYIYGTDGQGNAALFNANCSGSAQAPTTTDSGNQTGLAILVMPAGGATVPDIPAPPRIPPGRRSPMAWQRYIRQAAYDAGALNATVTPATVNGTVTIGSVTIAKSVVKNSFETGTNGTAVSTGNSGGPNDDAFDVIAGTAPTFDNTVAAHGTLSAKTVNGQVEWTTSVGSRTQAWFRFYLYISGAPSTTANVILFQTPGFARLQINTSRQLVLGGNAGNIQTMTTQIPLSQWVRVEGFFIGSATVGQEEVKLFLSADSTTADETVTTTATQNTAGTFSAYLFGSNNVSVTIWLDDIGVSTTGYLGPSVVSGDATVTPATVNAVTAIPAVTVIEDETVAPAVVAGLVAVPAPAPSASSLAAPGVVAGVATVPAPGVTRTALVTSGTVNASVTFGSATPSASSLAAPAVVAGIVSIPAPAIVTTALVTPATVNASTAIPAPAIITSALVTPAVVNAVTAIPGPAPSASSKASPGVVAGVVSIPAPSFTAGETVTPATVNATVAIPAPSVSAGGNATVTPGVVSAIVSIPAATPASGAQPIPPVVNAPATVPAPAPSASSLAAPGVVAGVATVPAPGVTRTALVTPATVSAVVSVGAPSVSAGGSASVSPSVVAGLVAIGSPVVAASQTVTPATVNGSTSVPAVTLRAGATPNPPCVTLSATVPPVQPKTSMTVPATTVAATVTVTAPQAGVSMTANPATVAVNTTVGAIQARAGALVSAVTAFCQALISVPNVPQQFGYGTARVTGQPAGQVTASQGQPASLKVTGKTKDKVIASQGQAPAARVTGNSA